jgi:hypothetical protein
MKRLVVAIIGLVCALAVTVNAQDAPKKKHQLTDDQKAVMKELLAKYDANKDGKLDKEEKAKMSQEDKDKFDKAFPKKGEKKAEKTDAPK